LKAASQSVSYINHTIFLVYTDPQEVYTNETEAFLKEFEFYKERLPLELA
jgi:hypothetical protein